MKQASSIKREKEAKKVEQGLQKNKHKSVINNKYRSHSFLRKTFYLATHIVLHYEFEFFLQFSLCFHHVLSLTQAPAVIGAARIDVSTQFVLQIVKGEMCNNEACISALKIHALKGLTV